jgi:hypothetical protein
MMTATTPAAVPLEVAAGRQPCPDEAFFEDPASAPLVIGDPVSGAILSAVFAEGPWGASASPLWRGLAARWLTGPAGA